MDSNSRGNGDCSDCMAANATIRVINEVGQWMGMPQMLCLYVQKRRRRRKSNGRSRSWVWKKARRRAPFLWPPQINRNCSPLQGLTFPRRYRNTTWVSSIRIKDSNEVVSGVEGALREGEVLVGEAAAVAPPVLRPLIGADGDGRRRQDRLRGALIRTPVWTSVV
jgi:hypothetical protein